MRIQAYSIYPNLSMQRKDCRNYNDAKVLSPQIQSLPNYSPVFTGNIIKQIASIFTKNKDLSLSDYRRFELEDFKRLSESKIEQIRANIPERVKSLAQDSIKSAQILKEKLDKVYGKNGYVFVSIGRSPSTIAKVFEVMGVETKYIPMSGLDKNLSREDSMRIVGELRKYFKQIGLTNQKLFDKNKVAIFYDYTVSGNTLNKMRILVPKAGRLNERCVFRSINSDLVYLCEDRVGFSPTSIVNMMYGCIIEKFSSVPYLYYRWYSNPAEKLAKFKQPKNAKLLNLEIFAQLRDFNRTGSFPDVKYKEPFRNPPTG